MKDYIIFTVAGNQYAAEVEWIERIIHPLPLTSIPNAHPFIEGMMSYEKQVIRVINFRTMTDLPTYEEALHTIFTKGKEGYIQWVSTLKEVIEGADALSLPNNPLTLGLGGWLEKFSTHEAEVLVIVKALRKLHTKLYETGKEALWVLLSDPEKARVLLKECTDSILPHLIAQIDALIGKLETISAHFQKMLIVRKENHYFAIKVDAIEDMAQIDAAAVKGVDEMDAMGPYLELAGIVERKDKLVNVIKAITLPTKEAV